MHLEWLIVNCLKNMHFGHHCLLVKEGLQPIFRRILIFKAGCAFPMIISSNFRMGKHRDDDHEVDAPYFIYVSFKPMIVIIMAPLTSKARVGTKALRSPEDASFRLGPNADRA